MRQDKTDRKESGERTASKMDSLMEMTARRVMEMEDCSVLFEAESLKHDYGVMAIAFELPPMDYTHIASRNDIEQVF